MLSQFIKLKFIIRPEYRTFTFAVSRFTSSLPFYAKHSLIPKILICLLRILIESFTIFIGQQHQVI